MSAEKDASLSPPSPSRRRLLIAVAAAPLALPLGMACANARPRARGLADNPFTLGVASGDPTPGGVVLWTRLAPKPLEPGGGMAPADVTVRWEVAKDDKFKDVVKRGTAVASAKLAHSVHVEVEGLEPARTYWYRFMAGSGADAAESPVGRTRTAPAAGAPVSQLSFAFVSCQNWQSGLFTALGHVAREELDVVFHLGDYIYEGGVAGDASVRKHNSPEVATLDAYRARYALYKSDPDLQAAHAAHPFVVTWDDHEVENNYANLIRENQRPPGDFKVRRAAAYQAYYEHLPLRRASLPVGPDLLLRRRLAYGDLATFHVLDTRQYRTDQPDPDKPEAWADPKATLPGMEQEKWLTDGLGASKAKWNVLAQQVFMAQRDFAAGPEKRFSNDAWDGYPASRARLFDFLKSRKPSNPVVLTGDVHANWVADLKADFNDPKSETLGSEFVGTSISSGGNGSETNAGGQTVLAENPHIKFHNLRRGYVRCQITATRWRSDYRVVEFVDRPGAPVSTRASFVVEAGRPGVQRDQG
ncbi:MAG TPA: alkaline phosphatase D family protein [Armatimonadaceae bacterium]|nr:alkaline phosphatase D family protein [Armatimonadaceae bacterium]